MTSVHTIVLSWLLLILYQSPYYLCDESGNQEIIGSPRNVNDVGSIPLSCWHSAKQRFTIGNKGILYL